MGKAVGLAELLLVDVLSPAIRRSKYFIKKLSLLIRV